MGSGLAPHVCAAGAVKAACGSQPEGPRAPKQVLTWAKTWQPVLSHEPGAPLSQTPSGPPPVSLPRLPHSFVPWPFLGLAFYETDHAQQVQLPESSALLGAGTSVPARDGPAQRVGWGCLWREQAE